MKSPLLVLGVLAVLVLFSALIAPQFIDWSSYRGEIERYGSKLTGRQVQIDGPVRIRILPSPVLSVSGIRIASDEGGEAENLLAAESLELRMALTPLLSGKVEVQSMQFDGATFEFEHSADGGGNWQLNPNAGWAEFLSADSISVASATITNSVIILRDRIRGGAARLDDVELDVSAATLAGPYKVSGSVTHEDKLLYVSVQTGRRTTAGTMRLAVTLEPDGEYVPVYSLDGRIVGLNVDPRFDGRLRIARNLPALVEDEIPLDPAEIGLPFLFQAGVTGSFSDIALKEIEFLVDQAQPGAVISGDAHLSLKQEIDFRVDLEARHLDLDRIATRSGLSPADFAPGLEIVGVISDLMAAAPDDLRGRMRFAANALTIGGETIEAAEVAADVNGKRLVISRVGGVLPGRSTLELSGLEVAERAGIAGFEGDIDFATRDTRGFAKWAMPDLAAYLDAIPRGFKGASQLKGRIALDVRSVGVRQASFELDGARGSGAILVVPGLKPEIFSNLAFDSLDLDRYVPAAGDLREGEVGFAFGQDPLAAVFGNDRGQMLSAFGAKILFSADQVTRWGRKGADLKGALEVRDGGVVVQDVRVTQFDGTDYRLDGDIQWVGERPRGVFSIDLNTDSLRRVLRLEPLHRLTGEWSRHADLAAPAQLKIDLTSKAEGERDHTGITAKGTVGDNSVSLVASVRGEESDLSNAEIVVEGDVSSPQSGSLAAFLGFDRMVVPNVPALPGSVRVNLNGSLAQGADLGLNADLYGVRFDAAGLVSDSDGVVAADVELKVKSADVSGLLSAMQLFTAGADTEPVEVDVKGLVAATKTDITITGLGGRIAGVPIGLDGTADLSGDRPALFGNLTVATLDLPWAIARALSLPLPDAPNNNPGGDTLAFTSRPFNLGVLDGLGLNLVVNAGDVQLWGGAVATHLRTELRVVDGAASVERLEAELAGGRITADARLKRSGGQLALDANFTLSDADLSSLLLPSGSRSPLEGRMSLEGQLVGEGRSPVGLVSSLNGAGMLTLDNGALRGINPVRFSKALADVTEAGDLDRIIATVLKEGQMPFKGLVSAFEVENGVARFTSVETDGDAFSGQVTSVVDLPSWRLNADWTVSLKAYPEAPPVKVHLSGPLAAPERTYDTAALRSYFVIDGMTRDVQRLEDLQREERERLQRLEEMEKKAELERERRERERERERLKSLLTVPPEETTPAAAPETVLENVPEGPAPVEETAVPEDAANDNEPASTSAITLPALQAPQPELPSDGTDPAPEIVNREPAQTELPALPQVEILPREEPLPVEEILPPREDLRLSDRVNEDENAVSEPDKPEDDGAAERNDGPLDIQPRRRPSSAQQDLFADDPASWRK